MNEFVGRLRDMKMRQALNCWNDGMNEHLSGPATIERATELIRWADGEIFSEAWKSAKASAAQSARISELEGQVERLRGTLSAFRDAADWVEAARKPSKIDDGAEIPIRMKWLRNARAALTEQS